MELDVALQRANRRDRREGTVSNDVDKTVLVVIGAMRCGNKGLRIDNDGPQSSGYELATLRAQYQILEEGDERTGLTWNR